MAFSEIISRRDVFANRWVKLQEKTVQFSHLAQPQEYYSLVVPDYVSIVAMTHEGNIPLVRQFRPAVESYTWELPSGTCEDGGTQLETARRELEEETGYTAGEMILLGEYTTDVGRISNRMHGYFAKDITPIENYHPEPGMEIRLVTQDKLEEMIRSGEFKFALHLATWAAFKSWLKN